MWFSSLYNDWLSYYISGVMYLLGQTAHTIGNLWLSHWSDENAENPEAALNEVSATPFWVKLSLCTSVFHVKISDIRNTSSIHLFQTSMYMGVYGGVGVIEAIIEVLREMVLLLSCTSAGRGKNINEVDIIHEGQTWL